VKESKHARQQEPENNANKQRLHIDRKIYFLGVCVLDKCNMDMKPRHDFKMNRMLI